MVDVGRYGGRDLAAQHRQRVNQTLRMIRSGEGGSTCGLLVQDCLHEVEAGVVSVLGRLVVLEGIGRDQVGYEAVDRIVDALLLVGGHDCIVATERGAKVADFLASSRAAVMLSLEGMTVDAVDAPGGTIEGWDAIGCECLYPVPAPSLDAEDLDAVRAELSSRKKNVS